MHQSRNQPTPDPESARRALCAGLHALKLPVRMAFTHTFIGVVLCHILIDETGLCPENIQTGLSLEISPKLPESDRHRLWPAV